uniref:Sialidase-1 n=1 Tax=Saccoglossus kowalevskii TaxID=10224 RepID=A0ABM0MN67_SACKO|nr:PREDICTED: sialidase-1 isoform X1 [Saccoglossus kowalevskii]
MYVKGAPCVVFVVLTFWCGFPVFSAGFTTFRNVTPKVVQEKLIWIKGQEEVSLYRIPIISYTSQGSLIAASEARKYSGSDHGPKFLAVKRSTDKGYTWEPQQFVSDDGSIVKDGLNLGAILSDDEKGIMFIFYTMCAHYDHCDTSTTHVIRSYDDGVTWTNSFNVSEQIGTRMFAPGPGYGIQKKLNPNKGRLVVCGHSTLSGDGMFTVISDDHGNTWRYGGMVKSIPYNAPKKSGDFQPDECQPVELPDGSIMINMRNQGHYHCSCRIITRSFDGAETFSFDNLYFDEALIDPACAASTLYHNGVLFFVNAMSTNKRENLTLQWSYNNGTTWSGKLNIFPGYSAYSAMTAFSNSLKYGDELYILYEKGQNSANSMDSLSFVRVALYG